MFRFISLLPCPRRLTIALLYSSVLLPFAANADEFEGIEEILVTAEFRAKPEAAIASSVSVARPLERGDVVDHLEDILDQIPNVNFASGASRGRYFQIRGIGERGQFSEPLNPSVGLLVDGVDLSGIGAAATLFDVQQVEVLRGPQGTLYGANALAGLINIVTPAPSTEPLLRVQADAGDYSTFGLGVVTSGPINENTGYRISARRYADDGFMENDFLGRDNTNDRDERTLRGKVVWSGEQDTLQFNFGKIDVRNGYDAFSLDNDRTTRSDEPGADEQDTQYASVSWVSDRLDSMLLEANFALADSDISYGYDEDWTFTGFDPIGYTSTDLYERDRTTRTLEARLLSLPGEGLSGGWDWTVGVFALQQDVDLDRTYTFAGPFASSYETDRVAVYAELSRVFDDAWRLTVGGRYEQHSADYTDTNGVSFDPDNNLFGGRVLLEYTTDEGGLLYAGVTQGYKPGSVNQDGSLPADLRAFDEETLWNIELGYKAAWFDDRMAVRAALFRMQREDIQISTSRIEPVPGNPVGEFIQFVDNAAKGFNQGLELETEFQVTAQLLLFANVGWLDTEYEDFINANGDVLDGREQAHAPGYQFFAGIQYDFTPAWSARIELEGKDAFFFSDTHDTESDSYELLNASISYTAERWQARLWGRNITDEDYTVRGFFFGNDPRDFYTARPFTQLGEPSRVGLSVTVDLF